MASAAQTVGFMLALVSLRDQSRGCKNAEPGDVCAVCYNFNSLGYMTTLANT